jgi:hypothetical protein
MNVERQNIQNQYYMALPEVLKVTEIPGGLELDGSNKCSCLTSILGLLNPIHNFKHIFVRYSF